MKMNWKNSMFASLAAVVLLATGCGGATADTVTLSREVLLDKIKGGWAGQTFGCTYGGPTEFKYNGTIIPDEYEIPWPDNYIKWWYDNEPGLYDDVYTTVDLERMFREGTGIRTRDGRRPSTVAFLHCVGSRDEKVCQQHCSKVCCITGVKQAMEMRQMFPEADVFNFYMDIRMFGPGYEEMYREAQQKYNIHFIRGRISEASPMIDGRVQIKAEDTLTGRPLRMSVDMLILIVGMRANDDNAAFAQGAGLNRAPSGFMAPRDMFLGNVKSNVEGIFYAGTVTAPKNIGESLNEGTAAADAAAQYVGV